MALALCIILTVAMVVVTAVIVFANGMAAAPSDELVGKWIIIGGWVFVAAVWGCWLYFG